MCVINLEQLGEGQACGNYLGYMNLSWDSSPDGGPRLYKQSKQEEPLYCVFIPSLSDCGCHVVAASRGLHPEL